ncbi:MULTISPECIES: DUF4435 domain-containing protein [unclassified Sulfitobacter]|uniref:DUF4435 domain-containing protein n=1 Tax=unclassified Sulfitobacter TaxID=196795 RepID=UPI0037468B72
MGRIEFLSQQAEECPTALLQIVKSRGRNYGKTIIAVEGADDVTFLQSVISTLNRDALKKIIFENLSGKGNVLDAHEAALDSKELSIDNLRFVIDRDYDDLRGMRSSDFLWMTPTYSFENLLVSEEALRAILVAEYRCTGEIGEREVESICRRFKIFLDSYIVNLKFSNFTIYHCTVNSIKTNPHDEIIGSSIAWDGERCHIGLTDLEILNQVPKLDDITEDELLKSQHNFSQLDPLLRWRGKFFLKLFVKFLADLRKDRGNKNPSKFERKQSMQFNPELDPVRCLSTVISYPKCLETFIANL